MKRWKIEIFYKDGAHDTLEIEEIVELDAIVEGGADWNEIASYMVSYQYGDVLEEVE